MRLIVGITFLLHGLQKPDDLSGTERFFASLAIPAPELMTPLVTVTETAGGLLLIAGLATSLVAAALAADMVVAFLTAHIGNGFFVEDGGGELVLPLAGASIAIALTGAGDSAPTRRWPLPPSHPNEGRRRRRVASSAIAASTARGVRRLSLSHRLSRNPADRLGTEAQRSSRPTRCARRAGVTPSRTGKSTSRCTGPPITPPADAPTTGR